MTYNRKKLDEMSLEATEGLGEFIDWDIQVDPPHTILVVFYRPKNGPASGWKHGVVRIAL